MESGTQRRMLWTTVALLAALAAISGVVDGTSRDYGDQAFKRALVTFAVARTLNGVISVAQGTEVAIEPAGVGVNFSVGQVLDPINDLVERFSAVMLLATSSLGLQNVLLRISAWWGITALLAIAAGLLILALWWPRFGGGKGERILLRFLLLVVFVRFAVPVLVVGSSIVFDTFLAVEQAAATSALEATRVDIEALNQASDRQAPEEQSLLDRLGSVLDESLQSMDVSTRLDALRERVSNASEHIINLIVIFVLQTVILPIVFVWAFAELLKSVAARTTTL
jgi:hypothetical protein